MKVTVLKRAPEASTVTWEGKSRNVVKQWCAIEIDGLINSFQITHNEGERLLEPGLAEIDPRSFSVQNGRLQMTRCVLTQLVTSPPPTAKV